LLIRRIDTANSIEEQIQHPIHHLDDVVGVTLQTLVCQIHKPEFFSPFQASKYKNKQIRSFSMEMYEGQGYYADLKLDMPFKKTFANENEKEPLIVMLNVFLARKLASPIVDVDIMNPYIKGQTSENRDSIFDILCEDANGNKFLVEVQVGRQAYFIKRVLFYACMAVANSGSFAFQRRPSRNTLRLHKLGIC
jgi:hypothetical protein